MDTPINRIPKITEGAPAFSGACQPIAILSAVAKNLNLSAFNQELQRFHQRNGQVGQQANQESELQDLRTISGSTVLGPRRHQKAVNDHDYHGRQQNSLPLDAGPKQVGDRPGQYGQGRRDGQKQPAWGLDEWDAQYPQRDSDNQPSRGVVYCGDVFHDLFPFYCGDLFLAGGFPDVRQHAQPELDQPGRTPLPTGVAALVPKKLRHQAAVIAPVRWRIKQQQLAVDSFRKHNQFGRRGHRDVSRQATFRVRPEARATLSVLEYRQTSASKTRRPKEVSR